MQQLRPRIYALTNDVKRNFRERVLFMEDLSHNKICGRIAKLRLETAGPRGKSSFAKQLGLSASTYDYYEAARVPPANVLVRICEVTGADLRWLLTGREQPDAPATAEHPVIRRAAEMLARHGDSAGALAAFLDILAEVQKFPPTPADTAPPAGLAGGNRPPRPDTQAATKRAAGAGARRAAAQLPGAAAQAGEAADAWIPILGRSAAGIAQFWPADEDTSGVTTLDELVARHAGCSVRSVRPATVSDAAGGAGEEMPVQLVTLRGADAGEVVEFLAAPQVKARHGDAFALRIDGDSMAPDIRHGDLVVLSAAAPAREGRAAVVQLAGQIGVTCKLYRRDGETVHLVPINDRYEIATCPAGDVVWALRVLARART